MLTSNSETYYFSTLYVLLKQGKWYPRESFSSGPILQGVIDKYSSYLEDIKLLDSQEEAIVKAGTYIKHYGLEHEYTPAFMEITTEEIKNWRFKPEKFANI